MKQQFGQQSEQFIVEYLKNQNFSIVACNYKKFFGEIDIIAQKNDLLVFVEVKARKNSKISLHNLVTYPKQQKIVQVARFFISQNYAMAQDKILRFDVALLHIKDQQEPEVTYIENAFGFQNY